MNCPAAAGRLTPCGRIRPTYCALYHEKHLRSADVAIELPTGAGKTIPGLLIAEWRRIFSGHRVLYACPTQQLARQVAEDGGNA